MKTKERPLVAISACLLGTPVRYDNNHCKEQWIVEELSKFVNFYPLCPEMEMGLGTPREEIHLYYDEGDKTNIKLRTKNSKLELSSRAMDTFSIMNNGLDKVFVDGFILTRKSPSCGLSHVKTINSDRPEEVIHSQGFFAKNICEKYPNIPKIDNGRIKNLELREHFIKSVFAHFRFNNLNTSISSLQDFHKRYKYILMEHSPSDLQKLGRISANSEKLSFEFVHAKYYENFFATLKVEATVKKRYNTFLHIMGYLKKKLDQEEKQEILIMFNDFKAGILNYMMPVRFFEFMTKKHKEKYLEQQYYFTPYPKEMKIQKYI
jgi:uncharacterized protein YbgA (DUF1722 family)/uncharacterized protein YbbK (DUF523 family)